MNKSKSDYRKIIKPDLNKDQFFLKTIKSALERFKLNRNDKKTYLKYKPPKKNNSINRTNSWDDKQIKQSKVKQALSSPKINIFFVPGLIEFFSRIIIMLKAFFARENVIKSLFTLIFIVICFNFAKLQVLSSTSKNTTKTDIIASSLQITPSRRGQIFVVDLGQNRGQEKKYIPVTSTQNLANLYFNPSQLKKYLDQGMNLDDVVSLISSSLNLSYQDVYNLMKSETDIPNPKQYVLIQKFISENQKNIVDYLKSKSSSRKIILASGLGIDEQEIRSYPEGKLLASVIGYVPKQTVSRNDALKTDCRDMILENEKRSTVQTFTPGDFSNSAYSVGYYGLEQKFCSELAGLNGRRTLNNELNTGKDDTRVVNGADIYTTIDKNIQFKAEQILAGAIKSNSNANGAPKNGTIVVMEANTGKVLAMASNPTFDPEKYYEADPNSFRNVATTDYEIGSVMKPLTVAAAINEYQSGNLNSKGDKLGVPPDFKFEDSPDGKRIYQDNSGEQFVIRNSQNKSYANLGQIGLDVCLINSINTCISRVTDSLGNRVLQQYFSEKYLFGKPTAINLPGDTNGNIGNLEREINCQYCYAQHGFGQGLFISPLQLLRGYTTIANNGLMVDPYIVEKIKYANGTEDNGTSEDSVTKKNPPTQILKESASRIVTGFMVEVVQKTAQGVGANKAGVAGYTIAGKTGTAEKTTNINGKFCNYSCNTEKGLYEHTFVGFNVNSKNRILILVKLDEPRPGEVTNFSGDTVGPSFSEMMGYTLNYLGIKEDPQS